MARPISRAFALMLAFALPQPALAEEPSLPEEAERLMGEGIASLMQALELLLKTVPQYAAPEMLPNGDIIIRRLQPQDEAPAPPSPADPESDSTDT
jgi:hypothetical protein